MRIGFHTAADSQAFQQVRKAGYPLIFTQQMGIETNFHMCGTAVAGHNPATSVLDAGCRSHDIENLWLADASSFPSSAALNPALTIGANALRIAPAIAGQVRSDSFSAPPARATDRSPASSAAPGRQPG